MNSSNSGFDGLWGCVGSVLAALISGIVALIVAGILVIPFSPPPPAQLPPPPSGAIQNVWVDYNGYENGTSGMRIHVNFNISHRSNIKCTAIAYFWFASGGKLYNGSGGYHAADGQVAASAGYKPEYEDTTFSDLTMFMPYYALYSTRGKYDLMFQVQLYDPLTGKNFASSSFEYFTISIA